MKFLVLFIVALWGFWTTAHAQNNAAEGGPVACPAPTAAAPVWVKMVKAGSVITGFYGMGLTQPATWTRIGAPQTFAMAAGPIEIGLAITAHDAGCISQGTVDNVTITPAAATGLPFERLQDKDVGAPELMGAANLVNGVWSISGSGADIWGASDQFNFQAWYLSGNFTILARVTGLSSLVPATNSGVWQKIGIMIRDGFNSGSDYAFVCATSGSGVDFQYRLQPNANPDTVTILLQPFAGIAAGLTVGQIYYQTNSNILILRP